MQLMSGAETRWRIVEGEWFVSCWMRQAQEFEQFPTLADDFVHDIAYDYYGQRLATCSSDRKIRVFERDEDGRWRCTEWQAHRAPVLRIDWAHPEFGQLLASCSLDHDVTVWEESEVMADDHGSVTSRWTVQTRLSDSRWSINVVKFAPKHLGLQFATGSDDGKIRLYHFREGIWGRSTEFEAIEGGVMSLSWNDSRYDPAMLVAGGKQPEAVVFMHHPGQDTWLPITRLTGHTNDIHDVAWAPSVGRSFHLIATASRDTTVRVWHVTLPTESCDSLYGDEDDEGAEAAEAAEQRAIATKIVTSPIAVEELVALRDHGAEVWRVGWNVTGSVLASSGDDGTVRLWKQTLRGYWKCVSEVRAAADREEGAAAAEGFSAEGATAWAASTGNAAS